MQPAHVSLWLRPRSGSTWALSVALAVGRRRLGAVLIAAGHRRVATASIVRSQRRITSAWLAPFLVAVALRGHRRA